MELYEKLKAEISLDNIYKDMAYLIDEVGERLSGSKEMEKATEYICKRLNENIGEGRIDHFPMYMSYPGEASLSVLSPKPMNPARPVCTSIRLRRKALKVKYSIWEPAVTTVTKALTQGVKSFSRT